jgi:hypothetical protein
MNIGTLLGSVGFRLDPVSILRQVLHLATPAAGRAALRELFVNHMTADARQQVGALLVASGKALSEGRCNDAADAGGDALALVKL